MALIESDGNWELQIAATGITVVCLLDEKCGACVRQKPVYNDLLVTYPALQVVVVSLRDYPAVRHKYGVTGSVCTMFYKDGAFQKRCVQSGVLEYSLLKTYIERLKNGQPVDSPSEINPPVRAHTVIKMLLIPAASFQAWLASTEGQKLALAMQTKIWYNAKSNDYEVTYLQIVQD